MGNVIKVRHDGGWSAIPNALIEARDVSWRAKGVWSYMYSRPDGWEIREADMIVRSTDGRDSVRSAIRELEDKGYLTKTHDRSNGRFTHITYELHVPSPDSPSPENPSTVEPSPDNPTHNKKEDSKKEEQDIPRLARERSVLANECAYWMKLYPKRDAPVPMSAAVINYIMVRQSGVSCDDLVRATNNYYAWCEKNKKIGTQYVYSPITFLKTHWKDWLDKDPAPTSIKSSDGFRYTV